MCLPFRVGDRGSFQCKPSTRPGFPYKVLQRPLAQQTGNSGTLQRPLHFSWKAKCRVRQRAEQSLNGSKARCYQQTDVYLAACNLQLLCRSHFIIVTSRIFTTQQRREGNYSGYFNARMWDLYRDSVCDVRKGSRIDYCLICICILK